MRGKDKEKWKISFHRSSKHDPKRPPKEFLCPVSGSLMADPVIIFSGQTFERISAQVCINLNFSPVLEDGSKADFSAIIPNMAIKSTILLWCEKAGIDPPRAPDYMSMEKLVLSSMALSEPRIRVSEMNLIRGVPDRPPVIFSHAVTELNMKSRPDPNSRIIKATPPLPLMTRPESYSSPSLEIDEPEQPNELETLAPSWISDEDLIAKLRSSEVCEQEEAVIWLRRVTKLTEETRIDLCNPPLLEALRPLIVSRYSVVQTNALAALLNLSLEKPNKLKIVRSGFVPFIVDVLKGGFSESQEHAAGTLFSLALDDENKMAIGVLGALPPLLHALRSENERTRNDSALALYQLTLVHSNRVKLVKLGAVSTLLTMAKSERSVSRALLILTNLAACAEGRSALLDGNAVGCIVGLLREERTEAVRENCVAVLFAMSHGSLRFRGLAMESGAVEVLREIEENGSERAREKAKRILGMMKRTDAEDVDWDGVLGVLDSGGFSRSRLRGSGSAGGGGPNSTPF